MASSIKLTNANGKILTITNPDSLTGDSHMNPTTTAYTIETVDDFGSVPSGYTTVIVKDSNRGGTFTWSSTGTANGGTVFAGLTGYWNRQYSGAVNVKWFGARFDGVTDDTIAIQNSCNYIVSTSETRKLLLGDGITKISNTLVIDSYFVSLEGYCLIDASSILTGTAIQITCSVGSEGGASYGRKSNITGNIRLKGAGAGTATVGIDFSTSVNNANSSVLMEDFTVFSFGTGHKHSNRAYNLVAEKCEIFACGTGISMPSGAIDYGEKITYIGCAIYNSNLAVYSNNPAGAFHFISCSFDYNIKQFDIVSGRAFLYACHVEAGNYASEPITVGNGNGATFIMEGGWLLCTGTNTSSIINVSTTANGGGGASFNNVSMNNLGSASYFGTGNGRLSVTNTFSYNTAMNPLIISASNNLMMDGGFEGASVLDAYIAEDTAAIISRTTGTNIILSTSTDFAHSGLQSLKASKLYGGGSPSAFHISTPIKATSLVKCSGWYTKQGANTGQVFVTFSYANIQTDGTNVLPKVMKFSTIGGITLDFTSAIVPWSNFILGEPMVTSPSWATHFVISFNLINFVGPGNLYIDDVEITQS